VIPNIAPAQPVAAGTVGSATCFYPGRIWAKRINNLDCFDEFHGVLAWSQNELCGFIEDGSSTEFRIFKSNLVTSYTETFKKSDGSIYFRKISNSYLISVSFRRQIIALTQTPVTVIIADEDAPTSLEVIVNGDALYDVATKKTIITFQTTIAWPYKIDDLSLVGEWKPSASQVDPIDATATLATVQPGELQCDQVQDTECEQSWILIIDTNPTSVPLEQVCNLKGLLEFSTDILLCRDYVAVDACQADPSTNFTISIGQTDLCDNADAADASAGLTSELVTYYDAGLTVPQAIFQTGDMVYFKLIVNDPVSTIDQITFKKVMVTEDGGDNDILYFQPVSGAEIDVASLEASSLDSGEFNEDAQFNITSEFRQPFLNPKTDGVLLFQFRLLRDALNVVDSLSTNGGDITQSLTVEVTYDILYHGNQKRTVTATNLLPAVAHSRIAFYDTAMTEENELMPHNNEDALDDEFSAFFGSSASSVAVSAIAVVAAAALVLA